jgi:hypothetical protein
LREAFFLALRFFALAGFGVSVDVDAAVLRTRAGFVPGMGAKRIM